MTFTAYFAIENSFLVVKISILNSFTDHKIYFLNLLLSASVAYASETDFKLLLVRECCLYVVVAYTRENTVCEII